MKTFIDAGEVAELIGSSGADHFLRIRPRLEVEDHFPVPMPTCQRPLKWRRDQITAWRDAQGLPQSQTMSIAAIRAAGPNVVLMNEAKRR